MLSIKWMAVTRHPSSIQVNMMATTPGQSIRQKYKCLHANMPISRNWVIETKSTGREPLVPCTIKSVRSSDLS